MAFTTLINALVIALAALLPGRNLGTAAVILAGAGISSTIGMTVLSLRDRPGRRRLWGLAIIPVLGVLYILQLHSGINLLLHPGNPNPVHFQALLTVIFFMIAIARAWQMIGARDTRLAAVVGDLVRERHETPPTSPQRYLRAQLMLTPQTSTGPPDETQTRDQPSPLRPATRSRPLAWFCSSELTWLWRRLQPRVRGFAKRAASY